MDLIARAAELGIETSFVDATGHHRTIDRAALEILVASVPERQNHDLLQGDLIWLGDRKIVPELSRIRAPLTWQLHDEHQILLEDGISSDGQLCPSIKGPGIYRLGVLDNDGVEDSVHILSVPSKAFQGAFDRVWLLAVQLYGVKSSRNWGIGDFADLSSLLKWAADAGAAGIGLNPLHVLFDDDPEQCSPYSPNSRLFLNPLYIDVAGLPEWDQGFADEHAEEINALRDATFVDYRAIAQLKREALRSVFMAFKSRTTLKRRTDFEEFRAASSGLFRFACFETLRRKFGRAWWEWPEKWRSPSDVALAELREGLDAEEIQFTEFQQWIADRQLKSCCDLARDLGMSIGLYLDIAVGVTSDGFDAWNEQVAISRSLSVGAPPDILNTAGQDWGLAGFNASGLEQTGYRAFRAMLDSAMRYAGAVRIDHVLGLNRLYLVPRGYLPSQGAYVQMPLEALLAVTSLESVKHRCVVVGEDLGTVPDGFRERMSDWGIWSYRVMMFERDYQGSFHPIDHYPENALVTFNTHDLATYRGWKSGYDIGLKKSLGLDPGETQETRVEASAMLVRALLDPAVEDEDFSPVLRFLSKTRCRILAVSAEDLLNVLDQPNIPGTIEEHPNWRQRLPQKIENWNELIDTIRLKQYLRERLVK